MNIAPIFIGALVAVLFGIIHCLAIWLHFPFPSTTEHEIWKVAAFIITDAPLPFQYLGRMILSMKTRSRHCLWNSIYVHIAEKAAHITWCVILFAYILARIALLVLPLISLRALPRGALDDVEWSKFFPHL